VRETHVAAGRCAAVLAASLGALAPVAAAQAPSPGGGGGGLYVATPTVTKVSCVRRCASKSRAQGGSTIKLTGSGLSTAAQVIFGGSYGRGDDLTVKVRGRSDTTLSVRVPLGAITGPITVVTAEKGKSRPTKPLAILPPPPPEPNAVLSTVPGLRAGVKVETGTSRTRAYVGARRAVTFSYRITGELADAPTVELVRASDDMAVKTWTPEPVGSGEVNSISWDGRLGRGAAKPGRYSFRLSVSTSTGAQVRTAQATDGERDAFDLYDNIFPIRGRHDYGDAQARFGARRAGHRHQGQDVMAKCGTPLVAARGGTVKFKQYHAAAGNYVVIDAAGTGTDYVYMHMAEPTPFRPGDRVYTGQRIGSVGDTGDAEGCHLHLELWTPPGWYDGGKPFDPLASLQAWDSWS
jgi:murein DD-endopeptidase MepM/ murein hydrolase activator NlpD